MKHFVWGLVILLAVLHHDLWNWNNPELVFGFMPVTLAYHGALSIAASIVWLLATKFAWPENLSEPELTAARPADSGKDA